MQTVNRGGISRIFFLMLIVASCATSDRRIYEPPKAQPPFSLIWPMNNPQVSEFFGWRGRRRMHEGIDVRGQRGDPVFASGEGKVIFAGRGLRGYGNVVLIQHPGPWATLYAHLSRVSVKKDQLVGKGQMIGNVGSTGRSTGPHLHFEVRYGADPVDPMVYLPTQIKRL